MNYSSYVQYYYVSSDYRVAIFAKLKSYPSVPADNTIDSVRMTNQNVSASLHEHT